MLLTFQNILAVAIGGAVGSVLRFVVGVWSTSIFGPAFPWGTLIINISGSFLIGVFVELFALRWDATQVTRIFLTVGICGGYTTFSTFSLDAYALFQQSQYAAATAYVIASVVASILGLVAALHVVRMV